MIWGADAYSPLDFSLIDPHWGTIDDWRDLVDECHKRGLYVHDPSRARARSAARADLALVRFPFPPPPCRLLPAPAIPTATSCSTSRSVRWETSLDSLGTSRAFVGSSEAEKRAR